MTRGGGKGHSRPIDRPRLSARSGQGRYISENRPGSWGQHRDRSSRARKQPDGYTPPPIGPDMRSMPPAMTRCSLITAIMIGASVDVNPSVWKLHPRFRSKRSRILALPSHPGKSTWLRQATARSRMSPVSFQAMTGVNGSQFLIAGAGPRTCRFDGRQAASEFDTLISDRITSELKLRALAVTNRDTQEGMAGPATAAATCVPGYESSSCQWH